MWGSTDAVERRLRSFGTVRAMVWGAYGEASDDVHQLLDYVVVRTVRNIAFELSKYWY